MRIELSPSPSKIQTTTTARSNSVTQGSTHHDHEGLTRRRFLAATAASTATIAMPHVRGAHAAGKLTYRPLGPLGARRQRRQHSADRGMGGQGEGRGPDRLHHHAGQQAAADGAGRGPIAKTGHDILTFRCWGPADHAKLLEPVDDVMEPLIKQNGAANATAEYLGKSEGHWAAVPATRGSNVKGPCSRIDLMKQHAGIDVQAMYPAGGPRRRTAGRSMPSCKAAQACHKAGFPFGIGLGTTTDSVDSAGAIFDAFGAAAGRCQGQYHRQDRRGAPGARLLHPARPLLPAGRARLGRRLQQQVR